MAGKTLRHYEIRQKIGHGGMGTVYKAWDPRHNRSVAVKVLHNFLAYDSDYVKRFHREARAAARLSHPNIVKMYELGEADGFHYIVMELARGKTLDAILEDQGRLSVGRALDVTSQAIGALVEAHRKGIIHRDIKPENTVIKENWKVKITDFGLAKALNSNTKLTMPQARMGTPKYMPPERCLGEEDTFKGDVYSLGVMLFEMLTGRSPFNGNTPLAVMYQVTTEPFPKVRSLNPEVPPEVEQLVENMVHRDVTKRYDAFQVLDALWDLHSRKCGISATDAPGTPPSAQPTVLMRPMFRNTPLDMTPHGDSPAPFDSGDPNPAAHQSNSVVDFVEFMQDESQRVAELPPPKRRRAVISTVEILIAIAAAALIFYFIKHRGS
ncbi:MAG: serine/threonine protein kinase [Candidatus Hydrogenedentes bacterium]|nr:serine/threonine protein kinase [Candidatus Hydrogenedentota bacterium]